MILKFKKWLSTVKLKLRLTVKNDLVWLQLLVSLQKLERKTVKHFLAICHVQSTLPLIPVQHWTAILCHHHMKHHERYIFILNFIIYNISFAAKIQHAVPTFLSCTLRILTQLLAPALPFLKFCQQPSWSAGRTHRKTMQNSTQHNK